MYSAHPVIPPWMLFHVPHDSTLIPHEVRERYFLSDMELDKELRLMTDHHTRDLFTQGLDDRQVISAGVSRLVVDVERFEVDDLEPMSSKGMGVIYIQTHNGRRLRAVPTNAERQNLLDHWYYPHHRQLESKVDESLSQWGKALLIDCHSYPSQCLPYELNQKSHRPEICIGTDPFHTPGSLIDRLSRALVAEGFETGIDTPFSGSLVPKTHYRKDGRLDSVMIEVRRDLYLDEDKGVLSPSYEAIRHKLRRVLLAVSLG